MGGGEGSPSDRLVFSGGREGEKKGGVTRHAEGERVCGYGRWEGATDGPTERPSERPSEERE